MGYNRKLVASVSVVAPAFGLSEGMWVSAVRTRMMVA